MSLGEGNKFGIISPTHNFKLVTRLQHVSHAVRAASRPADNNRSRDKIGRLSATCDDILCCFVCWLRRESGAYRPISMKSWPWRRHKIWIWSVARAEIEGEIANQIAHHSGIVIKNTIGLAWTVHLGRRSNAISVQNVPWFGRQKNFECGGRWGEASWKAKTSPDTITR